MNEYKGMLRQEHLSKGALTPFPAVTHPTRLSMMNQMFSQAKPVLTPNRSRTTSGVEEDLGDYMFHVDVEHDAEVIRMYRSAMRSIVIVKYLETNIFDMLEIPAVSRHGFTLKPKLDNIHEASFLPAGTILAEAPGTIDGELALGKEALTGFLYDRRNEDDSVMVREGWAAKTLTEEITVIEYAMNPTTTMLGNLYGDSENYRPLPEIGSEVRDDGLLMFFRELETGIGSLVTNDILRLTEPRIGDHTESVLNIRPKNEALNVPRAIIANVEVFSSEAKTFGQLQRIIEDSRANGFYSNFYEEYPNESYTPRMMKAIERDIFLYSKTPTGQPIIPLAKDHNTRDIRIKITVSTKTPIKRGDKIVNGYAGKGVCVLVPDDQMPYGAQALTLGNTTNYFLLQGQVNINNARIFINSVLERKQGKVRVIMRDYSKPPVTTTSSKASKE